MRALALAFALLVAGHAQADGPFDFPQTNDGRKVLAVDLHTHSVFSDGHVWPTIRVWEAEREGLAALAVTEHLEKQPHADDIPHPDRNRPYEIAAEKARADFIVINGAEITRELPLGHVNAIFLKDTNALLVDDPRAAVEAAVAQGGFTFWNHPYWTGYYPDGIARLTDLHLELIGDGLLRGIEVATNRKYSEEALAIALEHDLTVIGTSDVHTLVDWEHRVAAGGHRTVTLVLVNETSEAAIRGALDDRQTLALYKHQLIGRPEQVEAVLKGAVTVKALDHRKDSTVLRLDIVNDAPIAFTFRDVDGKGFYDSTETFTVPAKGTLRLLLNAAPDPSAVAIHVDVMNTLVAPRTPHRTVLRPSN